MPIEYRTATATDRAALADLRWALYREDHPGRQQTETPERFRERFGTFVDESLASRRWTVWVASDGDRLVANAWIYLVPKVPRPDRKPRVIGYLTNVYILPEMLTLGVGTALLRAVKTWARSHEVEELFVWPSGESSAYYRSAGFAPSNDMLECDILGYDD